MHLDDNKGALMPTNSSLKNKGSDKGLYLTGTTCVVCAQVEYLTTDLAV